MGWRKSILKVVRDGARRQSAAPTSFSMGTLNSNERLLPCGVPLAGTRGSSSEAQNLSSYVGADSYGALSREVVALRTQQRSFSGLMEAWVISAPRGLMRIAGIHGGNMQKAVEPTYGVGPVRGADRDPKSKGSTPDDFRADDIHMAEPKEITKEKAAIAQEEPPDFQVKKVMREWEEPVQEEADAQRRPEDEVFENETRKLSGAARKQGDTTGLESEGEVEGQYGATSSEGKTTRA